MNRYFITGGTGFIGREIVRQLIEKEDTESIVCLTRGIRTDLIQHPKVSYRVGNVTQCNFPIESLSKPFTHLIHGAADANDAVYPDKTSIYYTIVEGTSRILEWGKNIPNILVISSGGATRDTFYGRAKHMGEGITRQLCPRAKIARIFSVIGEEIPLNGQFAIGRFIGQAKEGEVSVYGGDAIRTYLDISDCARWLFNIMESGGTSYAYDVGGNEQITIMELAKLVSDIWDVPIEITASSPTYDAYIPYLSPALSIGCEQTITLKQSLERIHAELRHPD